MCCSSLEAVCHHSSSSLSTPWSPPHSTAGHPSGPLSATPLASLKKGANHYNWHHAGQLSQLGEAPLSEVWVKTGWIDAACQPILLKKDWWIFSHCNGSRSIKNIPLKKLDIALRAKFKSACFVEFPILEVSLRTSC